MKKREYCEKLNSKRNDVIRCGNRVIKNFSFHEDYINECSIYERLKNTSLAPKVISKQNDCIVTEYINGISLFDELERLLGNQAEQARLFTMFFDWYSRFRTHTACILGDTNFKNFIIKEGALYGLDFETCKRGDPFDDLVWQAAMLATLCPAFSPERTRMTRLFLSMGMQSLDNYPDDAEQRLKQAFEDVCKRRKVEINIRAIREILSSIEVAACLLAGGRSSRMGEDKRLLTYKGKSLLTHSSEALALFGTRFLSLSQMEAGVHLDGFKNVPDQMPPCGPIGGIVSTLSCSLQPWALFVTSDMPFINRDILDYLLHFRHTKYDVIMFSENGKVKIFPLLLQTQTALPAFRNALQNQTYALWKAIECSLNVLEVKIEHCPHYQSASLKNINTREDYADLKNI